MIVQMFRAALSNLVANRHMWRQTLLMWRQAQFFHFHFYVHFDKNNIFKGIAMK